MTRRFILLLLFVFASLPAAAQNNDKETPPDPLAMPLPEGILTAVRFTVGGDVNSTIDQAGSFNHPVLLQIASDRYLHRMDLIVVDRKGLNFASTWQFRSVFLFPDMGSFVQWYASAETKKMIGHLTTIGMRNLGMKIENIRNPQSALQK